MALLPLIYTLTGIPAIADAFLDDMKSMHVRRYMVGWARSVWYGKPNVSNIKHVNQLRFLSRHIRIEITDYDHRRIDTATNLRLMGSPRTCKQFLSV